jgi:hypothetical protein
VTDIKKRLENEELDLEAATKQISRFMDSVDLKIFSTFFQNISIDM